MRIALLNLRYSPNLGDVLLCECLEFEMRRAVAGLDVVQIDITGRQRFAPASSKRLAALAIMQRLPLFARQCIARVVLGRSLRRILPLWKAQFATINAAVLGGGNLLADADLNFPLKVAAILSVVAARKIPAAVHAVGVSDNWSTSGQSLFRKALTGVRLVHAAVRDEQSRTIWNRRLGSERVLSPIVVRDPGLLAADCYPRSKRPRKRGRDIGICMTHPVALAYHADEPIPDALIMTEWFRTLANAFVAKGDTVHLFTTGSPEDETYLDSVIASFKSGANPKTSIERIARFDSAAGMAGFLSSLDLMLGHRLHACIAAYAFDVPNIGFSWDQKMQSFFHSVQRGSYIVPAVTTSVAVVMDLAEKTFREGIDMNVRASVVAETRQDVATLLKTLAPA